MKTIHSSAVVRDAEFALKAYILKSDRYLLADCAGGAKFMQFIEETVDLTEAPEDAVCSLVIDLMQYCDREKIDWSRDVMMRAMNERNV